MTQALPPSLVRENLEGDKEYSWSPEAGEEEGWVERPVTEEEAESWWDTHVFELGKEGLGGMLLVLVLDF
jgi:hypothetical protein